MIFGMLTLFLCLFFVSPVSSHDFESFSFDEYELYDDLMSFTDANTDDEALDSFIGLFESDNDPDFILNDEGFFSWIGDRFNEAKDAVVRTAKKAGEAIKNGVKNVVEAGTKFLAKNGDLIAKGLQTVGKVAGVVSKVAGVVSKVSTVIAPFTGPFAPAFAAVGAAAGTVSVCYYLFIRKGYFCLVKNNKKIPNM
ncbi:hypothetical protein EIN_423440 [Entamoeba invadens IP1]|uniref:Uncharacterized protein n=1 Tax=Entamoeba invadens IP1 TaxID=370355 RepID=A0A0A1UGY0_ENTIV|nr:hypothetical protein EIN_423440 [Entamoeba invadens IP1]ELP94293.1 hypothetical protein EIN_423440 [Entamoeba invadens IP1]|eukprot:XP_004261064.1 hypothetical protein EIN_423440 [Entamoeba invadens IP1]